MDGTILGQGTFIASSYGLTNPNAGNASQGNAVSAYVQIPSGADWMEVRNYTEFGVAGTTGAYFNGSASASVGVRFFWQRGMAPGAAMVEYLTTSTNALSTDLISAGGFTLYDPSGQTSGAQPLLGPAVAYTGISNVPKPVISGSTTATLAVGSIVRLYTASGDTQLASDVTGIDFVVGAIGSSTAFTLLTTNNELANNPGLTSGSGHFRLVNYSPLFYPRVRVITNITKAVNAQVGTSIPHGLTCGQEIRFNIPAVSGMTDLNPQLTNNYFPTGATTNPIVLSIIDDYTFTINTNTTAYSTFTWPTVAQQPSSFPQLTPVGEDTATALATTGLVVPTIGGSQIYNTNTGILADSTVNTGYLGMILGIGGTGQLLNAPITGPAGSITWSAGNVPTGDTMYWVAGKSTYGGQ